MCGLVGVINEDTFGQAESRCTKFFKEGLFADTLRGADSTGIFLLNKDYKTDKIQLATYKKALAAPDFLQLKVARNLFETWNQSWSVMVGHNRAATKGGITDDTAHPFTHDNITLVHNGTISNHRSLSGGTQFDVDSEAITYAIAKDGIDEVVKSIDGAFALIYFDSDKNTLNIIRNEERPLAFGKLKGQQTTIISSEVDMMRWIASRNGLNIETAIAPKPGHLFTWDLSLDKNWAKEPTTRELKLYTRIYRVPTTPTTSPVPTTPNTSTKYTPSHTPSTYVTTRDNLLKELDLIMGETMVIDPIGYSEYAGRHNRGHGTLFGLPYEETIKDLAEIRAYSVSKNFYEYIESSDLIEGVITNAYRDNVTNKTIIQLDTASLELVYFEDTDNVEIEEEEEAIDISDVGNTVEKKTVQGPKGPISIEEFDKLTKHGCIWCGSNISEKDATDITWEEGAPLCVECSDYNQAMFQSV